MDHTPNVRKSERRNTNSTSKSTTVNASDISPEDKAAVNERPTRKRQQPKSYDSFVKLAVPNSGQSKIRGASIAKLEAAAEKLAFLDQAAAKEVFWKDIDCLHDTFLWPMTFPWMHREVMTLKNIPRDIDEMPGVLDMEAVKPSPFDNGDFDYGKFEVGHNPKLPIKAIDWDEDTTRAATRRSDDVGVIELTELTLPDIDLNSPPSHFHGAVRGTSAKPISTSLNLRSRSRKLGNLKDPNPVRTNLGAGKRAKVTKRFISVKFGGVSSRSSIFPKPVGMAQANGANHDSQLLVVNATLPAEVQNGKQVMLSVVASRIKGLGSYDIRYGSDEIRPSGNRDKRNREKRVYTGRVRLVWSNVEMGESANSRRIYRSSLTHSRLETVAVKRPRDVKVVLRLNGRLLRSKPPRSLAKSSNDGEDCVATEAGYTNHAIAIAISDAVHGGIRKRKTQDRKETVSREDLGDRLCLLDADQFYVRRLCAVGYDVEDDDWVANSGAIQPPVSTNKPVVDCLPIVDGRIRVGCSSTGVLYPGTIVNSAPGHVCTVCGEAGNVERCVSCGLSVHVGCCWDRGERIDGTWKCSACCKSQAGGKQPWSPATYAGATNQGQKEAINGNVSAGQGQEGMMGRVRRQAKAPLRFRQDHVSTAAPATDKAARSPMKNPPLQSPKCSLCPHFGGAMSPSPYGGWQHEICRIWAPPPRMAGERMSVVDQIDHVCLICSGRSARLTRCAAQGCSIHFHPMCAKIASANARRLIPKNRRGSADGDAKSRIDRDTFLCTQYTLTMSEVIIESETNESPKKELVPVAFCYYHNPERDPTLFGSYVNGGPLGRAMRIPTLPKNKLRCPVAK